jgi:hypothetical protein
MLELGQQAPDPELIAQASVRRQRRSAIPAGVHAWRSPIISVMAELSRGKVPASTAFQLLFVVANRLDAETEACRLASVTDAIVFQSLPARPLSHERNHGIGRQMHAS